MSDEKLEARRARWRAYYYRHHDKHLQRAKVYRAAREETPEQREHRLAYHKKWLAAHPGYTPISHQPEARAAYRRKQMQADPAKVRRQAQAIRLKTTYGITLDQYEALLAAQGGVCAICGLVETIRIKGTLLTLSIDHDHGCCPGRKSCGRCVRALLCRRCNHVLGQVDDDIELLGRLAAYLA